MHMQTASCFLINGFRQECCCLSLSRRHIFYNIFGNHRIIRHRRHIRKFYFYFHLSRAAYLMVMIFYLNSPVFHHHTHPAAQIISYILRRRYMISAFAGYFITVIARHFQIAVPISLSGIHPISATLWRYFKTGAVKQIKLKLRSDYHLICNAALFHIFHCF